MHLETPWGSAGMIPALPFRSSGPVDANAVGSGRATGRTLVLTTPWAAADVGLPTRATTHPGIAAAGLVPVPRRTSEGLDVLTTDAAARPGTIG